MKFSGSTVPDFLFALARDRMRASSSCTPAQLRQFVLQRGITELNAVSALPQNHGVIADRVARQVIRELVASGEFQQLKRGVWMKCAVLRAAQEQEAQLSRAPA